MPEKPNLLLLHGALGTADSFKGLLAILNNNFNVSTLTFSGHGGQPFNKNFSISLFTEEVLSFLNKNNIESTHIFGYSMGGYVALRLAVLFPERAGKIFTLGTKFQWTNGYAERETKKLNPEKIKEKVPAFAEELSRRHTSFGWENVLSQTSEMMKDLGNNNILTDEVIKNISVPVCVGLGDRDNTVEIEEASNIYGLLPSSSFNDFSIYTSSYRKSE
jgi:esterase/lipase